MCPDIRHTPVLYLLCQSPRTLKAALLQLCSGPPRHGAGLPGPWPLGVDMDRKAGAVNLVRYQLYGSLEDLEWIVPSTHHADTFHLLKFILKIPPSP